MKRFAMLACAAALAVAGCGSKSPTNPSNAPTIFTVAISSQNEVPPISNADANARGQAIITFNITKDSAGNVTAATATFNVTLSGFPAGTNIILAHIHNAPAGTNGGVKVNTGLTAGTAVVLTDGTGVLNASNIAVEPSLMQDILTNPQNYYFNAHSTLNPGGAVRGQLR